jgi:hypothetical protein
LKPGSWKGIIPLCLCKVCAVAVCELRNYVRQGKYLESAGTYAVYRVQNTDGVVERLYAKLPGAKKKKIETETHAVMIYLRR